MSLLPWINNSFEVFSSSSSNAAIQALIASSSGAIQTQRFTGTTTGTTPLVLGSFPFPTSFPVTQTYMVMYSVNRLDNSTTISYGGNTYPSSYSSTAGQFLRVFIFVTQTLNGTLYDANSTNNLDIAVILPNDGTFNVSIAVVANVTANAVQLVATGIPGATIQWAANIIIT